jgi:hypothetical protein
MTDADIQSLTALGTAAISAIEQRGGQARLIGGIAIELTVDRPPGLRRPIVDVDVVTRRADRRTAEAAMAALDLTPDREVNALHGAQRQIWWTKDGRYHLDLFIGELRMCHRLQFEDRLDVPGQALAPEDLLLTKLQIVELTDKDVSDLAALLLGTAANHRRIAELCAADWGLYTTVQDNLGMLDARVARLRPDLVQPVADRAAALSQVLTAEPKRQRWRVRARVGRRVRWYELPDEVAD